MLSAFSDIGPFSSLMSVCKCRALNSPVANRFRCRDRIDTPQGEVCRSGFLLSSSKRERRTPAVDMQDHRPGCILGMTPISLDDTGQRGYLALRLNPDCVAPGLGSRVAITNGVTVVECHDGMAMPVLDP